MSKLKHTPGPWTAINALVYNGIVNISNCGLEHLKIAARLEYYSGDKQTEQDRDAYLKERFWLDEQELYNAKLIASAPDLLECLIDCIDNIMIDFPDNDVRKIKYKKAIEKATK